MKLTTFSDYSLRVLIYLALEPDRLATIQGIADSYDISENHLMKVVHQLAKRGVVESLRGKGGGIRLAVPAENIRIGKIIRDAEGDGAAVECFGEHGNCKIKVNCKLAGALSRAFDEFYRSLDQYTLADLVDKPQGLIRILRLQN